MITFIVVRVLQLTILMAPRIGVDHFQNYSYLMPVKPPTVCPVIEENED